jgi:hypothetical protein
VLIFTSGVAFAQLATSREKGALRDIGKHHWQKAESRLRKALDKDTLNPSVRYVLSILYFATDNPAYNLDSAYYYVTGALHDYARISLRDQDRMQRISVDTVHLLKLRSRIDSAAFEVARESNTEASYLYFLSHYPTATQRGLAEELRDEVAYQGALRGNTYQDFQSFISRYPLARRVPEARANYERLLYLEKTADKRLASFERFLAEHPETPYRPEIVHRIFEISTADGSVSSFMEFMAHYPDTAEARRAGQLVFHLLAEEEEATWPAHFLTDSLRALLSLNSLYLVPILENNRYGFMDEQGRDVLLPQFNTIDPDYLCGLITTDVLQVDDRLVARNGAGIYDGEVQQLQPLGAGFLKITVDGTIKVIHKAGFTVADSLQDARILSGHYLALRKFDAWFLYTLTGRLLDANPWDDIVSFEDVVAFRSGKKLFLIRNEQLGGIADGHPLSFSAAFDEIRAWSHGLLWARSGDLECVFDRDLRPMIPLDKHKLTETFFGISSSAPDGYTLYNWLGQASSGFQAVSIFDQWVTVKKAGSWLLFDPRFRNIESRPYDTMRAEGPFVVGALGDTLYVHFRGNRVRMFVAPLHVSFIPGMDTTSFLLLEEERQKTLYDLTGRKLFSAEFDAIQYAGEGVFAFTRKDRKGLMNLSGEILLPAEYDAIGSAQNQLVSLLKNRRFGSYNIRSKTLIKPQYDRNLYPYGDQWITTFRDGHYGFLGWDNKPISKFEFDEISFWNDSLAWARIGNFWNLYEITSARITAGNIRNINMVRNTKEEKVAIVQRDNSFGVMSNRRDIVVPITFSDIVNLGSAERPLYFTEKQVREASLFIVIYYDADGALLRKEIYDDPAEYDRIYCPDK